MRKLDGKGRRDMINGFTTRATVDVDGIPINYLTAGAGGPLVLLLHGTYWSRVWQPVLDDLAAAGLRLTRALARGRAIACELLSIFEGGEPAPAPIVRVNLVDDDEGGLQRLLEHIEQ